MYPSEVKQRENVAELAKQAFARHTLEVRLSQGLYRNWRCYTPGTGMHSFCVSTEPWRLFLTGDIEAFVFERSEDMIPWLRGAIQDRQYLASQVD